MKKLLFFNFSVLCAAMLLTSNTMQAALGRRAVTTAGRALQRQCSEACSFPVGRQQAAARSYHHPGRIRLEFVTREDQIKKNFVAAYKKALAEEYNEEETPLFSYDPGTLQATVSKENKPKLREEKKQLEQKIKQLEQKILEPSDYPRTPETAKIINETTDLATLAFNELSPEEQERLKKLSNFE